MACLDKKGGQSSVQMGQGQGYLSSPNVAKLAKQHGKHVYYDGKLTGRAKCSRVSNSQAIHLGNNVLTLLISHELLEKESARLP